PHDRSGGPAARRRTDAGFVRASDDARGDRARGDPRGARAPRRQCRRRGRRARREPFRALPPHGEIRTVSARRRPLLKFQDRVLLSVLLAAAPAWALAGALLWFSGLATGPGVTIFLIVTLFVLGAAISVQRMVVNPLRSLANMLEALREEDYSLRGRNVDAEDAVGEVMIEVNALGRMLRSQRLDALEAGVLLQKVINEIDIAVLAFDAERRLRLINRAGEELLGGSASDVLGSRDVD